jgi:hypothetical protein
MNAVENPTPSIPSEYILDNFEAADRIAMLVLQKHSFLFADHSPTIAGSAAHRRNPNCYLWNLPVVSTRLRDDDRSATVLVPLPSVLDFAQRNSLGVDTQLTAGNIRQKLADGF